MTQIPRDEMQALGIGFDGRQYRFRGYRYDRCVDAIAHARLLQARADLRDEEGPAHDAPWPIEPPRTPSAEEREAMAGTDVGFAQGRFTVGPHRYDHLADALASARRERPAEPEPVTPGSAPAPAAAR